MANPTLYSVSPAPKRDTLTVKQVWSQDGKSPLAAGYNQIVPMTVGGQEYLVAFDDKGTGSAFRLSAKSPWIEPVASKISLGGSADIVEPFVIGLRPHLLSYVADSGTMSFIPIADDLSSRPAYNVARKRSPATTGYTVVKPLVFNGLVFILAYSFTTGEVDIFSLDVTAALQPGAKPGTPPLVMRPVWIHQWAKNWTHFAFFTLGLENFFFKINVGKINVNIDHINDDPSTGTVEVSTYLQSQLDDPKGVAIVAPFTMRGGDPYFVAYRKDGRTDFFRIHADCQGWTRVAEADGGKGSRCIVPYTLGDQRYQLFY